MDHCTFEDKNMSIEQCEQRKKKSCSSICVSLLVRPPPLLAAHHQQLTLYSSHPIFFFFFRFVPFIHSSQCWLRFSRRKNVNLLINKKQTHWRRSTLHLLSIFLFCPSFPSISLLVFWFVLFYSLFFHEQYGFFLGLPIISNVKYNILELIRISSVFEKREMKKIYI